MGITGQSDLGSQGLESLVGYEGMSAQETLVHAKSDANFPETPQSVIPDVVEGVGGGGGGAGGLGLRVEG